MTVTEFANNLAKTLGDKMAQIIAKLNALTTKVTTLEGRFNGESAKNADTVGGLAPETIEANAISKAVASIVSTAQAKDFVGLEAAIASVQKGVDSLKTIVKVDDENFDTWVEVVDKLKKNADLINNMTAENLTGLQGKLDELVAGINIQLKDYATVNYVDETAKTIHTRIDGLSFADKSYVDTKVASTVKGYVTESTHNAFVSEVGNSLEAIRVRLEELEEIK